MHNRSVTCQSCGTASEAGRKFCAECGAALPAFCPACGKPVLPEQKFCDECGTALKPPVAAEAPSGHSGLSPVSPLTTEVRNQNQSFDGGFTPSASEERRLVTALFCDLVGFTPLSEQLDPEEVRDIQAAYFAEMSGQIERYGGTVEKYAGDAVLALFGVPTAHEDDAERAVLCALGMQTAIEPVAQKARERWDVDPSIRVGVNTGEVVSGSWDVSGRQDVAVTGDAVNVAARIQAAAEPGEVLVGRETMRLTRRRILYGDRRDLVLKGKASTVPGYPAIGVREQFGERWETSDEATPLVGRERELLHLLDAWIRAQGGEGQLVTLIGDAGVGKSRLITEVLEKVGTSIAIRVLRARCLSYGQEISLWLIADLLRGLFGISEQDLLDEVRVKLRGGVGNLLKDSDAATQAEVIDVLGEVLGLPAGNSVLANAGAQIRRQALIRHLRLALGALSERAPTILVVEDLHWIDEASAEVVTQVLSDVPGLRLLVLAAQRPGWAGPWTNWGWTERLALRPLRDEEAAVLAGLVLGGMKLSPELEQYVAERAGGNPFFVEEMLRALQETGGLVERTGQMYLADGAAERLPSTLTEVLLARLDRLESQVRSMAQVASVIGRSFAVRLLAQVVGREAVALDMPLMALQRAEIAFPRRGSDLEYVFKHVSMREVAYNTLVQKRRQELHLATARAIASLYPSDEYVEMIAYHFARTEENAEAADWLERAGDRAAEVYANQTAIDNYEEARKRLELSGAQSQRIARVDQKLGGVLATVGRYEQALDVLGRAADAYRENGDIEELARVTGRIGWTHRWQGTPEDGIRTIGLVLEELSWAGPSEGLASLHLALAYLHFGSGRYQESLEAAERASDLAHAIGDERILGGAEMRRGTALSQLGQPEDGMRILEGSITLLEKSGDLETAAIAYSNLASSYQSSGQLQLSRRWSDRVLEAEERLGGTVSLGFAIAGKAELLLYLGEWEEAAELVERGAAMLESVGTSWYFAYGPLHRGFLRHRRGQWAEAATDLEEAISLAQPMGDTQALELANWLLAEQEVIGGRAQTALDRLQDFPSKSGPFAALLLMTQAWAEMEIGSLDQALETATGALAFAQERHQRLYVPEILRVTGAILTRQERWDDARASLEEALALNQEMPHPYGEARVHFEFGLMHLRKEEPEQAREELKKALETFERLGASGDVERTRNALVGLRNVSSAQSS